MNEITDELNSGFDNDQHIYSIQGYEVLAAVVIKEFYLLGYIAT
jgi:hypothetical protein